MVCGDDVGHSYEVELLVLLDGWQGRCNRPFKSLFQITIKKEEASADAQEQAAFNNGEDPDVHAVESTCLCQLAAVVIKVIALVRAHGFPNRLGIALGKRDFNRYDENAEDDHGNTPGKGNEAVHF